MGSITIPPRAMHYELLDHLMARWERGQLSLNDLEQRLRLSGYTKKQIQNIIAGKEP